MIYYNKKESEVEGAVYVKDMGWFVQEELGIIAEAENNCRDYLVNYSLTDYLFSEKIYENETRNPLPSECLIDNGRHIGFFCYGAKFILGAPSEYSYPDRTIRTCYLESYKKDGNTVMPIITYCFTLEHMQRELEASKEVKEGRFSSYDSLKELIIPEGVEVIKSSAFSHCKNLERIIIPASVKKIEQQAFCHCYGLNEVYILGDTEVEPLAFERCDHLMVAFGPGATVNYYSFYIYERHEKIGGSAYWANYGFDHYAVDKLYFIGTKQEYESYISGNEQLGEYLKKAEIRYYSETAADGCWRFVGGIPAEW